MHLKDVVKWNTRVSGVYAIGMWTLIGSYGYVRYTRRHDEPVKIKEAVQEPEDPNQVILCTTHTKTTIVYRKDFVPYSKRISNFFRSFSGEPECGDGDGDNEFVMERDE